MRRRLITFYVLDSDYSDDNASIDHDGDYLDEEDVSGLVGACVTEYVEYMQKTVKYSSPSSYMFKPSHLLTQGFEDNRTTQEKFFIHMCNFGQMQSGGKGE